MEPTQLLKDRVVSPSAANARFGPACIVLFFLVGGCVVLDSSAPSDPAGQMDSPQVSTNALAEHLEVMGRDEGASGTRAAHARYLSDRLREYLVQPAVGDQYNLSSQGERPRVAGHVGGRNPRLSGEAVLVSVDVSDPVGVAAWLELARLHARFARSGILPERSIVFVATDDGEDGVRRYLRSPTWSSEHIQAWIHINAPGGEDDEPRSLASERGWRYHPVLRERMPDAADLDEARSLVERGHMHIRAEVLSHGAFLPIRPYVLIPPREDGM